MADTEIAKYVRLMKAISRMYAQPKGVENCLLEEFEANAEKIREELIVVHGLDGFFDLLWDETERCEQ